MRTSYLLAVNLGAVTLLLSSVPGCGRNDSAPIDPPASPWPASAPSMGELEAALQAEFDRLGIDPSKVTATAPQGPDNFVFDLSAEVTGDQAPFTVTLTWTERMVGDYSQDGAVNISDLTPLGAFFSRSVAYGPAGDHGGLAYWPSGSPDDPAEGSPPANNWRLARIDGDSNGLINISDITPIAAHWQEHISGFKVYRKGAGDLTHVPLPDFPDRPTPAAGQPVRYSFVITEPNEGTYSYKVRAWDDNPTETLGSDSNVVVVQVPPPPEAVLSAMPASGEVPLDVVFDASASTGSIIDYSFDFDGDGTFDQIGPEAEVSHTYDTPGAYDAVVRVTDANQLSDTSDPVQIVVGQVFPPNASFTADPMIAEEAPATVNFDASASSDQDGTIVSYEWDWEGDGVYEENNTASTATHFYAAGSYDPILRVTDDDGLTDTFTLNIKIGKPPVAELSAAPQTGSGPLTVNFDASGSYDPNGVITQYKWDWNGDGVGDLTTTIPTAQHTFDPATEGQPQPWDYTVIVTVYDNDTPPLSDTDDVEVHVNHPPTAVLESDKTRCNPPLTVSFDASGSSDSDGSIVKYEFNFGEGAGWEEDTTAPLGQEQHIYSTAGTYQARARVTDNTPGSAPVQSAPVSINVNAAPVAQLTSDVTSGNIPFTVNFDASGSIDSDGAITKYEWDFDGNGSFEFDSGTDATVSKNYDSPPYGTITVQVRVSDDHTDDSGSPVPGQSTATRQITKVNDPPVASLTADPTSGGSPLEVTFDASGSSDPNGDELTFDWDWEGDGTFDLLDGGDSPVHTYEFGGRFYPAVRVIDADDEFDTASVTISVDLWTHSLGGSGNERGYGVALDSNSKVWVCGVLNSLGANGADLLLLKYSPSGALLMQKGWGYDPPEYGNNAQYGNDLIIGADGSVFVAGRFHWGPMDVSSDILIAKFDADGETVFQTTWDNPNGGQEWAAGIQRDSSGNIYVAGEAKDIASNRDVLLLKYSSAGNLQWQKMWNSVGNYTERANAIAIDSSGNIYLTGFADGATSGMLAMKLSSAGSVQWAKKYSEGNSEGNAIATDSSGNLYIAGQYANDLLVMKLDSSGSIIWQYQWGSTTVTDYGTSVSTDAAGNVYIGGPVGGGGSGYFFLALSSAGEILWQHKADSPNTGDGALIVDSNGILHLANAGNDASNNWQELDYSLGTLSGSFNDASGSLSDVSGTEQDVTEDTYGIAGTEDIGGGNDDAFIMKWDF